MLLPFAVSEARHLSHPPDMEPLACPGCGATRGLATESKYELANGHHRRLRSCRHCGGKVRTIQPPGEPERLAQEVLGKPPHVRGFKLTPEQVVLIRQDSEQGIRQVELAKRYGVRRQAISQIVYGDIWADVGGPIKRRPPKAGPTCESCEHFAAGSGCSFGFPEAVDEPWFASECELYQLR